MTDKDKQPQIGSVEVVLYAGLRGEPAIEVGTVRVPLHASTIKGRGVFEANLREAIDYTGESLVAIFRGGKPS